MSLYIVKPITITDAILDTTDVPETDYSAWASGTTYAVGARVILVSTHRIYESLQNANTNKAPATEVTWWVEVSATNAWKLFDTSNNTQTTKTDSMTYTLTPGQVINTVSGLNLVANSIRVRMIDSVEGTVYDTTETLTYSIPDADWYEYFFADVPRREYALFNDLPAYASADITVDITYTGSTAKCGVLILGYQSPIGDGIEHGARVGIVDYSRKEVNAWGDTVLTQRAFSKRADFSMLLDNDDVDVVFNMLANVRAVPVLWIGSETYGSTVIYGYYKDFDIGIVYPTKSECNIQIEGLT